MGKTYETITPDLRSWIEAQRLFFVATAPLGRDGRINCSPKGLDSLRILGPREVVYLDLTGSGIETVAHLKENGRIVLMFCAFEGPPLIVRLHGRGVVHEPGSPRFVELAALFPGYEGTRSFVHVQVDRISDACGYGVPTFTFAGPRDHLERWVKKKGPEGLVAYRAKKNRTSIDCLPGLG